MPFHDPDGCGKFCVLTLESFPLPVEVLAATVESLQLTANGRKSRFQFRHRKPPRKAGNAPTGPTNDGASGVGPVRGPRPWVPCMDGEYSTGQTGRKTDARTAAQKHTTTEA